MSFSLHTVDIDVDFEHIQSGSILNSISDFIDNTFDNRGNIPVSYTHLDVYKRQVVDDDDIIKVHVHTDNPGKARSAKGSF